MVRESGIKPAAPVCFGALPWMVVVLLALWVFTAPVMATPLATVAKQSSPKVGSPALRDPSAFFFDQSLGDFSEELETARDEGKAGIFIFFEMDDCPFCHRMKTTILNQPRVQAFYKKHFLNFVVNIEGDVEISDFDGKETTQKDFSFKQHRVRATPTMIFFDTNGKRISKYIGPVSSVDEFLLLGEYVVSGAWKSGSFSRYKRKHRRQ